MASAYILHRTDRTEEEYIMPKPSPDPEPNHPLGPLITIRILSDNSDPTSSMPFDTNWERMRIKARFGTIMAGGAGYWWEEGCDWLNPEDTPDKVSLGDLELEEDCKLLTVVIGCVEAWPYHSYHLL